MRIRTLSTPGTAERYAAATAEAVEHGRTAVLPNPFRNQATLALRLNRCGALNIALYDLNGRRVRTVYGGAEVGAGLHEFQLDGRDDRGRPLGSGVFFYRAQTPDGIRQGRFVILE